MPRGDRTGPMGMGPMTGRGAGYCAGYDVPGYMNPGPGRGYGYGYGMGGGRGRGGGRGWRNWYYATGLPGWARAGYAPAWGAPPPMYGPYAAPPATPAPEQEAEMLQTQVKWLQEQMDAINRRLEELGGNE